MKTPMHNIRTFLQSHSSFISRRRNMKNGSHAFDPDGDLVLIFDQPNADFDPSLAMEVLSLQEKTEIPSLPVKKIRYTVSSKLLIKSSPVFKAMLQHSNFHEGVILAKEGKVEIALPEDDPEAFVIILQLIHNDTEKIPFKIELPMLHRIAIVVDKYQMLGAVGIYAMWWARLLEPDLPKSFKENIVSWLLVTWVFQLPEEFKLVTGIAQRESDGHMEDNVGELPIPSNILNAIETSRVQAIQDNLQALEDLFTTYEDDEVVCEGFLNMDKLKRSERRFDCTSMFLGSMTKSCISSGLLPLPVPPFLGWSAKEIADRILALSPSSFCNSNHASQEFTLFKGIIENALQVLSGLSLKDFKKTKMAD